MWFCQTNLFLFSKPDAHEELVYQSHKAHDDDGAMKRVLPLINQIIISLELVVWEWRRIVVDILLM